ncbi:MAG: hypothetical protein GX815_01780, partial [Clostridiales bacterium]|nr:hypothetical protein [Clostridiales bacterium]
TLWNRELNFETIQKEYFQGAFGEDSSLVSAYLSKLSELFRILQDLKQDEATIDEFEKTTQQIISLIKDFAPIIEKSMDDNDKCIRNSWCYLEIHQQICIRLAKIYEAISKDEKSNATKLWDEIKALVQEKEDELQTVLDVYLFISTLERVIGL